MSDDSSSTPAEWTPERMREALLRRDAIGEGLAAAAEHLAGEDDPALADLCDAVNRASEAHAREDLPAALAEIERRATHAATWKALARRLMRRYRSERRGHDLTRSDRKKHRAEIERLTAELAADTLYRAAEAARTTIESAARFLDSSGQGDASGRLFDLVHAIGVYEREAAAAKRAPTDASLETVGPFVLASFARLQEAINTDQGPIEIALRMKEHEEAIRRACEAEKARLPLRVVTTDVSLVARAEGALRAWRNNGSISDVADLRSWLAVVRAVDASRPGISEEEAQRWGETVAAKLDKDVDYEAILAVEAMRLTRGDALPEIQSTATDAAIDAAVAQRPSEPPDPRATLHAGDPASLADVVAASAREPHADVVLQALHVSGGAAAVDAMKLRHDPRLRCARCDKPVGATGVRDGEDVLCLPCSIDDLDGRDLDREP